MPNFIIKLSILYRILVMVTNHTQIQTQTNSAHIGNINGGLNILLVCVLSHKFNIRNMPFHSNKDIFVCKLIQMALKYIGLSEETNLI